MSNTTDIRGLMQFRLANIETLTLTPNEKKDPTASLKLSAELTPDLAEIIRCKPAVFDGSGKPHPQVTRLDLGGVILRDIDLNLPSPHHEGAFDVYRPEDVASFRIEVDGMLVRLQMLVRIKGRYLDLVDFLEHTNTDDFEFAIRSLQNEFDWSGKGGTGTKVSMGSNENQNVVHGTAEESGPLFSSPGVCIHCDQQAPKNEDGMHMVDGELTFCEGDSPAEKVAAFAGTAARIPDVRDMGIRKERVRNRRGGEPEPLPERSFADGEPVIPVDSPADEVIQ